MQTNGRRLGKAERHRLLAGIVARKRVGTQLELAAALAAAGCPVTQATISRDIRELGLEKTHDALGRPRYEVPAGPERRRSDPRAALGAVLSQFGRRAAAAQNIVVLHSELGSAPAIARALDQVEHPLVVGTIAGDDTCLVVARDGEDARSLAAELSDAIG
jgi:transcriptional regulator of arginine metabolism